MNIEQARQKATSRHVTSISLDNKGFELLIHAKRSEVLLADNNRVMLSKRRGNRVHYFLNRYADKITILDL